jgi:hypothetical protein
MRTEPKFLMMSDLHYGSRDIPPHEMADAFRKTVFPMVGDVDLICINGDFYDDAIEFDSVTFDCVYNLIVDLMRECQQHGTKLRLMQGTWTHDRGQVQKFDLFYKSHQFDFDFRFVRNIDFEEISFGEKTLRFMYVPDDIGYTSSEDAVQAIKEKMSDRGWDYVDYGCMHDFFDFTFPKNVSTEYRRVYREEQFPFVHKAINVGHVHQYRVGPMSKAISNGGFDRYVHGDEDAKGMILYVDKEDSYTATFVENKFAAVFDTLVIPESLTTEQITKLITDHLNSLATDRRVNLRFVVDTINKWSVIREWMRDNYRDVRCSMKRSKTVTPIKMVNGPLLTTSSSAEPEEIPTPANLATLVKAMLNPEDPITIDEIQKHLDGPVGTS